MTRSLKKGPFVDHHLVAKVEKAVATQLMAQLPTAGSVVVERHNAVLGTTELELSNGVRVILKPTDFKNDEILLGASRFGGQSLFDQADKYNAGLASAVVNAMGVADFAPTDLQKMLAGKVLGVNTGLGLFNDFVSASSSNADLETMLQLLSLRFGPPRRDADRAELERRRPGAVVEALLRRGGHPPVGGVSAGLGVGALVGAEAEVPGRVLGVAQLEAPVEVQRQALARGQVDGGKRGERGRGGRLGGGGAGRGGGGGREGGGPGGGGQGLAAAEIDHGDLTLQRQKNGEEAGCASSPVAGSSGRSDESSLTGLQEPVAATPRRKDGGKA